MVMQLPLNVSLDDDATFQNFYIGDNAAVVSALRHLVETRSDQAIYVWGASGSGHSHLLQATCHYMQKNNGTAMYLSLSDFAQLSPEIFDGMEQFDLVVLDDIDAIANNMNWQEALFHFYNRAKQFDTQLAFAARGAPRALPWMLADLQSRLSHGLVFHLQPLSDKQKIAAVSLRAKNRGLELSPGVGQFLLNHYQRDMSALFQLLERLDVASIAAQRKLTLPFVRQVLSDKESVVA
ncbi:MAG: DnaA regulatory inactivator Hda [Coxiellaceae bacterium]|nr:DnaA regulatory inactivator Hda [Coxiellaceae bacterium]